MHLTLNADRRREREENLVSKEEQKQGKYVRKKPKRPDAEMKMLLKLSLQATVAATFPSALQKVNYQRRC